MNASQAVNDPAFRKLTCVNEEHEYYEVQLAKYRIKLDVPIQFAVFILNMAKLRLLSFTYDHVDRLVDRSDYMLLETETDSLYMALSKPTFEEVVRPHLKEEYERTVNGQRKDGPAPCCDLLAAGPHDKDFYQKSGGEERVLWHSLQIYPQPFIR